VFGHAASPRSWSASSRIWSVPREAWRTGSPYLCRRARQRAAVSFGLDAAVSRGVPPLAWRTAPRRTAPGYVRPTSATQPTCLPAPALVALVLSLAPGFLRPDCATDRGTRRFTTSSPASTGSDDAVLGCSPSPLERIELLTPLSPARAGAPPSQATASSRSSRDRRRSVPVKGHERGDDPRCLPSVGRPGYRTLRRSRPASCDAEP
jgi:hypothetical protein